MAPSPHLDPSASPRQDPPHHGPPTRMSTCAHGPGAGLPDGGREAPENTWLVMVVFRNSFPGKGTAGRWPRRLPGEETSKDTF